MSYCIIGIDNENDSYNDNKEKYTSYLCSILFSKDNVTNEKQIIETIKSYDKESSKDNIKLYLSEIPLYINGLTNLINNELDLKTLELFIDYCYFVNNNTSISIINLLMNIFNGIISTLKKGFFLMIILENSHYNKIFNSDKSLNNADAINFYETIIKDYFYEALLTDLNINVIAKILTITLTEKNINKFKLVNKFLGKTILTYKDDFEKLFLTKSEINMNIFYYKLKLINLNIFGLNDLDKIYSKINDNKKECSFEIKIIKHYLDKNCSELLSDYESIVSRSHSEKEYMMETIKVLIIEILKNIFIEHKFDKKSKINNYNIYMTFNEFKKSTKVIVFI